MANTPVVTNRFLTYSPMYQIFLLFLYVVTFVINTMTLIWLYKLDEISCKCSDNWMRTYIKYFIYVYFAMIAVSLIVNIYLYVSNVGYKDSQVYQFFRYAYMVFNVFGFVNIIIAIIYIDELKKTNCVCSEDVRREIYWYFNIIRLAIISLTLLLLIILISISRKRI